VENVVEGRDVDLKISREEFSKVTAAELERFRALVRQAMEGAGLSPEQLDFVEISGGAMRMPALQAALQEVSD
jgi:molecular chaperone DnaK (HSP70)